MNETSTPPETLSSDTAPSASPILKQDTYVVWDPLTPSEIEWLRRQSEHVAEVFRRSRSIAAPD